MPPYLTLPEVARLWAVLALIWLVLPLLGCLFAPKGLRRGILLPLSIHLGFLAVACVTAVAVTAGRTQLLPLFVVGAALFVRRNKETDLTAVAGEAVRYLPLPFVLSVFSLLGHLGPTRDGIWLTSNEDFAVYGHWGTQLLLTGRETFQNALVEGNGSQLYHWPGVWALGLLETITGASSVSLFAIVWLPLWRALIFLACLGAARSLLGVDSRWAAGGAFIVSFFPFLPSGSTWFLDWDFASVCAFNFYGSPETIVHLLLSVSLFAAGNVFAGGLLFATSGVVNALLLGPSVMTGLAVLGWSILRRRPCRSEAVLVVLTSLVLLWGLWLTDGGGYSPGASRGWRSVLVASFLLARSFTLFVLYAAPALWGIALARRRAPGLAIAAWLGTGVGCQVVYALTYERLGGNADQLRMIGWGLLAILGWLGLLSHEEEAGDWMRRARAVVASSWLAYSVLATMGEWRSSIGPLYRWNHPIYHLRWADVAELRRALLPWGFRAGAFETGATRHQYLPVFPIWTDLVDRNAEALRVNTVDADHRHTFARTVLPRSLYARHRDSSITIMRQLGLGVVLVRRDQRDALPPDLALALPCRAVIDGLAVYTGLPCEVTSPPANVGSVAFRRTSSFTGAKGAPEL